MCSSKIDHDSSVVTVTTPSSWAEVGHRLYVIGSGASYGIDFSDWLLRLTSSQPNGNGKPWGEGVDVRPAETALREALRNGEVHPSLVAEPTLGVEAA